MRVPQTTGRVRRGPGQALRAVFTGIGQMFLAADRLKEQVESAADAKSGDGTAAGWSHESVRVAGGKAAPGQTAPGQTAPGKTAPGKTAPGKTAGRADRSRRSASAGAGTAAQSRWRSLDTTGNVRLLSAEDLALEFPETPTAPAKPDEAVRPGRETPRQTLIVGQSPTLDRPPVAHSAVDDEETADDLSASDEVTETAAAPAPVAPAS
jgi:hypothetical protein